MKRLKVQRRGKGSPRYTANTDSVGKIRYSFNYTQEAVKGEVVDILHNSGKSAPLAKIVLETNETFYVPAGEGFYVGLKINAGYGEPFYAEYHMKVDDPVSFFNYISI